MEIAAHEKLTRLLLCLALTAFLSVILFGISPTMMGMKMNSKGEMSPCPFSSLTAICKMNPLEHITAWQKMFTTTLPQKVLAFALLTLLMMTFVAVATFKRKLLLLFSYGATRWRLYIRHNPHLFIFNNLREVFSQGILNPKTFELVIV